MMDQMNRQRMRQGTSSTLMQHQLGSDVLMSQQQAGGFKSTKSMPRQNGGPNESNVVKSLLTGNKYFTQSSNRQKPPKQEEIVDASQQQNVLMANIPTDLAPGEKLIAVLEGVTYEIMQGPNQELIARPVQDAFQAGNSNISLEELANISAEQETLKLVEGGAAGISVLGCGDQPHHQQIVNHHQVVATTGSDDTMQIIVVPEVGSQQGKVVVDGVTGTSLQDFVLQTGQPLPPEIQELIAKGGIDLSNYEFVIQEDPEGSQTNIQQQVFVAGGAGTHYDAATLQEMLQNSQQSYLTTSGGGTIVNTNDVLALLAEASSAVAQHESSGGIISNISKQVTHGGSLMAPDDEDDEEFLYAKSYAEDEAESGLCTVEGARIKHINEYAQTFTSFVNGVKPETLTSVTNSSVIKKPTLPPYIPEFTPVRNSTSSNAGGTPGQMGLPADLDRTGKKKGPYGQSGYGLGSNGKSRGYTSKRGRGRDVTSRIINRRTRGSDEDSYDDLEDYDQMLSDSDLSDPGWKPNLDTTKKTPQQPVTLAAPRPRGRGRGRPRGRGAINNKNALKEERNMSHNLNNTIMPEAGVTVHAIPNEPHFYQKSDFVLERKDVYKREGFPIWRIEAGRLLQKFDPVIINDKLYHRSASIYSSWSGEIRTSFKAIKVDLLSSSGKRNELVKMQEEFVAPPYDESMEQDALIDLFNIYVQDLISQGLDNTFLAAIHQQNEEYYLGPLRQIDVLLMEAQNMIANQACWSPAFKDALDQCPHYRISELATATPPGYHCQATDDPNTPATRIINLFGSQYHPETLEIIKELEVSAAETFLIGQTTIELILTYHALCHFKFLLYKDSQEEVTYRRIQGKDKADEVILSEALKNRVWVQQHLKEMKDLLQRCSIVITVVSKGDEQQELEQMVTSGIMSTTTTTTLVDGVEAVMTPGEATQYNERQIMVNMQQSQEREEEEMEGVMVSTAGLTDEQLAAYNVEQSIQAQHQGGITVMQVDAEAAAALEAGPGQAIGLVQLDDGSVVHAIYDPSMVTLLQQQQLGEIDQSQLTPEQQQLLQQQLLLQQQQLAELDQSQLDPEQQLLLQQQQLAEFDPDEQQQQQHILALQADEQAPMSM